MRLLHHHPATPPAHRLSIAVASLRDGNRLSLRFRIDALDAAVLYPAPSTGERRDELWRTTCFEAFVRAEGLTRYHEFNFSPSGDWAAYSFDGYRAAMRDAPAVPQIERRDGGSDMTVALDLSDYPDLVGADWEVSLTTVIEETDGTLSYWALHHPRDEPDFHHAACFVLELPAGG